MAGGREFIHVAHLEGLAAVGMVKRFWTEDCLAPNRKKVVAELTDGRIVETRCTDVRGVKKIIYYLGEQRRLSRLVVEEGHVDFEEVFEE